MTVPPGTIGLSTINGHVGAFVRFGQLFYGAGKYAMWSHAFLVGEGDTVYQAMPKGMERASLKGYLEEAKNDDVMFINVPLSDEQRAKAVAVAEDLVNRHVGYSFASYLYLVLKRRGFNTKWLRDKIGDVGNMICSQTVDFVLSKTGFKVFDDMRPWQDVVPADFARLVAEDSRFSVIALT